MYFNDHLFLEKLRQRLNEKHSGGNECLETKQCRNCQRMVNSEYRRCPYCLSYDFMINNE